MNVSLQLPNKRRQQIRWSARTTRSPRNFSSKPISIEFQKLKQLILDYEFENSFIRETISAFNELNTNPSAGEFLTSQFDLELQELTKRIDERSQKIDKMITKSQMKKQRPMRTIEGACEKQQALEENKYLIEQALNLEKQNILYHLKLRVSHDHRDLCKLKCDITRLIDGDKLTDEEMEIMKNKIIIRNLKQYIEHEKMRSMEKVMKQSPEDEAATKIQSTWRSFAARKELERIKRKEMGSKTYKPVPNQPLLNEAELEKHINSENEADN